MYAHHISWCFTGMHFFVLFFLLKMYVISKAFYMPRKVEKYSSVTPGEFK